MFGDRVIAADGWAPVERVSFPVVRASTVRIVRVTRFVGPGEQDATLTTVRERPIAVRVEPTSPVIVSSSPAIATASHCPPGSWVLDQRLRWWTEQAHRHVLVPAMDLHISFEGGGTGGWPAIGSPNRRRIWARRVHCVNAEPPANSARNRSAANVEPEALLGHALAGTHPGVLTEWPIVAGASPRKHAARTATLQIVGPEAICREGLVDCHDVVDLRPLERPGRASGAPSGGAAGLSPG